MDDPPENAPSKPAEAEASWPPRFSDKFLACSAGALVVVFVGGAWLIYVAFDSTIAAKTVTTSRNAAAFIVFVLGLLALLLGAFFALVEAKKPAVQVTAVPVAGENIRQLGINAQAQTALDASVTKMAESFSGRRVSAVLLAIGFTLVTVAAAGSGLVSVSVGDPPNASPSAPSSEAPSTAPASTGPPS